jgi:predicted nicotinamide N-methyase
MSRSFSVPLRSDAVVEIDIAEPALRAQGLSLQTWTGAFVLASLLHKFDVDLSSPSPVPILELGAGTGLVGLAAAALWKKPVILTDLPGIVPGLAGNIKLNASTVQDLVKCGSLDWGSPDTLLLHQDAGTYRADVDKALLILAADTVYSEEHPELLSHAILRWLAHDPSARAIITYPMRVAYLDQIRELWQLLEQGGLEAIDEGREQAEVNDWDDECLCEWSIWKWKGSNDTNSSSHE